MRKRFSTFPGAPPGVVATLGATRDGEKPMICEACKGTINHPSTYWYCGAFRLKRKKGVRHPDGLVYWHEGCLASGY